MTYKKAPSIKQQNKKRQLKLDKKAHQEYWDKVKVIRSGEHSDEDLSEMFDVSRSNVATVRCYGSWNK